MAMPGVASSGCTADTNDLYVVREPMVVAIHVGFPLGWVGGPTDLNPGETSVLRATVVGRDADDEAADPDYEPRWFFCPAYGCWTRELPTASPCGEVDLPHSGLPACEIGTGLEVELRSGPNIWVRGDWYADLSSIEIIVGSVEAGVTTDECVERYANQESVVDCAIRRRQVGIAWYWSWIQYLRDNAGVEFEGVPEVIPDEILANTNTSLSLTHVDFNGERHELNAREPVEIQRDRAVVFEPGFSEYTHDTICTPSPASPVGFRCDTEQIGVAWWTDTPLPRFEMAIGNGPKTLTINPGEVEAFTIYVVSGDDRFSETAGALRVVTVP